MHGWRVLGLRVSICFALSAGTAHAGSELPAAETRTSTPSAVPSVSDTPTTPTTPTNAPAVESYVGLSVAREGKLIVTGIVSASPAEKAGLRVGDEIFGVGGRIVNTSVELLEAVRAHQGETPLDFMILSDGHRSTRSVILLPRPAGYPAPGTVIDGSDESSSTSFGPQDGGLALGFSERVVTAVYRPVDYAHLVTWNLFMNQTFGGAADSASGGGGLGYRYLNPVGHFPGGGGGLTHSFSAELNFTGFFSASSFQLPDILGGGVQRFMAGGARLTALPSYTLLYFGGLNRETGVQSGVGFKVGAELGGSVLLSYFNDTFSYSFSPVVGPALGLELPSFNPGSAKVETFSVMVVVIPIEGVSLTVATAGSF